MSNMLTRYTTVTTGSGGLAYLSASTTGIITLNTIDSIRDSKTNG